MVGAMGWSFRDDLYTRDVVEGGGCVSGTDQLPWRDVGSSTLARAPFRPLRRWSGGFS